MQNKTNQKKVLRKIGGERIMLMVPFNVVMTAKIKGNIDPEYLPGVLEKLKKRHALLNVRIAIDGNNEAWLTSEDVPDFSIEVIDRKSEDQWTQKAMEQCRKSFDMFKGPLIRFSLLHSMERAELIICAHHIICDGISLTYLIRDILEHFSDPEKEVIILPVPPAVNSDTVPSPPVIGKVAGAVIDILNKKWEKKNITFTNEDMFNLHHKFWEINRQANLTAWESSASDTAALISRCRDEMVTVNTAIWTAFQAAQYEIQGSKEYYRDKAGMAVNIRDKLKVPAGEAFGFYASSLNTQLKYSPEVSFWDMARRFHARIKDALAKTNPFQMITAESIHPSLIDSLYFRKYNMMNGRLPEKFLKKMKWDKINYGYSITNVGKINIPKSFGELQLESVYGPLFYSDVNEKTVGVITISGKLSYLLSYNEDNIDADIVNRLKNNFNQSIAEALKPVGGKR